ncbi:beta-ketoacyl synthase N-terminal-like domain-containing protein [Leptothoe sp. EHU-05/26/07-4]
MKEPIAIIGIGCRFPGVNDADAYWKLLCDGEDAISPIPSKRAWYMPSLHALDSDSSSTEVSCLGGFLDHVEDFDCQFFEISPREAITMDPQQRLLLEVSWEALEDAGISPEQTMGSQGGVFVGISSGDYSYLICQYRQVDAYYNTGIAFSIAANRLSYYLDWHGPSLALDTACSSSLVAVHQACRSLQYGDCDLALAAGVNLILRPEMTLAFSQSKVMAADGRCKAFDARADGYVRGEGVGVVVLKPLSSAIANNDSIYAVIRGSAINQDGQSNGLMAPNPAAQEAVLQAAYQDAKVSPGRVQYVETHGIGTQLGDVIEAKALAKILSQDREAGKDCALGSVKTNLGHLEAAAGMASLIKVALALKHQKIPASLHFQKPNPYIRFERIPLKVQQTLSPWPESDYPALAGVSGFGFGGTNAHVVLEEVGRRKSEVGSQDLQQSHSMHLLTLSAKSDGALDQLRQRYQVYIQQNPDVDLADLCFTANTGRSHFHHRLAVVGDTLEDIAEKLNDDSVEIPSEKSTNGYARATLGDDDIPPSVAFLFPGEQSAYLGVGQQLYESQPLFRQTVNRCHEFLQADLGASLIDILYPQSAQDQFASLSDVAVFALEYSLAQLWVSWGVQPDFLIGHGLGEYVAACVAGVFSLEEGLRLLVARQMLLQSVESDGGMAVVIGNQEQVEAAISTHASNISIAAHNAPSQWVIAGDKQALQAVCQTLEDNGLLTQLSSTEYALYSQVMAPLQQELESVTAEINYASPSIPMISGISGKIAGDEITTPAYWANHLCQPVQFMAGMQALCKQGCTIFLEMGAKPLLTRLGQQCLSEDYLWLSSLRSGRHGISKAQYQDWRQLQENLAQLYAQGVSIDWFQFHNGQLCKKLRLPTYPFQRERYWIDTDSVDQVETPFRPIISQDPLTLLQAKIWQQLMQVEIGDRSKVLETYLQEVVAYILRLAPSNIPNPHLDFIELGMDSLTAMEVKNHIQTALGISLSETLASRHSSIHKLAKYLAVTVEVPLRKPQDNSEVCGSSGKVNISNS